MAQIKRDLPKSEAVSVENEPLVVSEAGPVAWVAGRASVQARMGGQELTLIGRFTAVLGSETTAVC
jgi:ketosteroid isomerase-like protein